VWSEVQEELLGLLSVYSNFLIMASGSKADLARARTMEVTSKVCAVFFYGILIVIATILLVCRGSAGGTARSAQN